MDGMRDHVDDGFTVDDLTGWGDSDGSSYDASHVWSSRRSPTKSPGKKLEPKLHRVKKMPSADLHLTKEIGQKPTRRLSGSQSLSVLSSSGVISPPPGIVLEPVTVHPNPLKDLTSPLAKPFAVYKYTNHKSQQQRVYMAPARLHIVTTPVDVETSQPRDDSFEHLPPLSWFRNTLDQPDTKTSQRSIPDDTRRTSGRRKLSARHRPPLAASSTVNMAQGQKHPLFFRNDATVGQKAIKQLCKNDKPTVARIYAAAEKRLSLSSTNLVHENQQADHDADRVSTNALYAPRRQSLSATSQPNEGDNVLDAEIIQQTSVLAQTLTWFASSPEKPCKSLYPRDQTLPSTNRRSIYESI